MSIINLPDHEAMRDRDRNAGREHIKQRFGPKRGQDVLDRRHLLNAIDEHNRAHQAETEAFLALRSGPSPVDHFLSAMIHAFVESVAPSLTCSEAEATAELYRAWGRERDAAFIIDAHSYGDDEDDDLHYRSEAWLAANPEPGHPHTTE